MTESAFLNAVDEGDTDAVKSLLSSDAGKSQEFINILPEQVQS